MRVSGKPSLSIKPGLRLYCVVFLLIALSSCEQHSPGTDQDQAVPDQQTSRSSDASASRVRFESLEEAEALLPLGMLRQHPAWLPGASWLGLRHARSGEGLDFEIRWQLSSSQPAEALPVRGGPGWFNIGSPGQQQLEASAAARSAHYRVQAPAQTPLVLNLQWIDYGEIQVQPGDLEAARGRRSVSGSFTGQGGETLHVVVRFSRAFRVARRDAAGTLELTFDPHIEPLEFGLALSTVGINGARANLGQYNLPDFGNTQRIARDTWDGYLGRIDISGSEALRQRTDTALYRLFTRYGDITDTDGQYRAANDALRRVVPGEAYLGNLLPEENIRTVIPMLSLLAPRQMEQLFATIMAHQRATGVLPHRTVWGRSRSSQALEPAVTVVAALVSRDLPGINEQRALAPLLKASLPGNASVPWAEYERRGYFSFDDVPVGSVSRSLEAALVHHSTAAVAAQLGERALVESFAVRVLFYRQLFDPRHMFFRGRDDERAWRKPFQPEDDGPGSQDFDEADPWAALWSAARFDADGLLLLLGGREELTRRLDTFFTIPSGLTTGDLSDRTGYGAYQAASPDHWYVPWLYPLSNQPARGQRLSTLFFHRAHAQAMTADRAAWELFTLLGFYPVMPSRGQYMLGRPQVASASLEVGDKRLFIEAPGLGEGGAQASPEVVAGASFDDARLPGYSVSHRRLAGGGSLVYLLNHNESRPEH